MLAAVETAITNRLSGGAVESYGIDGRNLKYCALDELYRLRIKLKAESTASLGPHVNYIDFQGPQ